MKKIIKSFIFSSLSLLLVCSLSTSVMANTVDITMTDQNATIGETSIGTVTIKYNIYEQVGSVPVEQEVVVENYDLSKLQDEDYLDELVVANQPIGYHVIYGKGAAGPSYWLLDECTVEAQVYPARLPFTDVKNDDWFFNSVYYVNMYKLMTGLNETTFGPYENLARAQFAVILHRMNDEPSIEYTNKFPDVANEQWYTDAILWASDIGVVTGYSDTGNFGPGDNINREQMAVMMYRYAQYLGRDTSVRADLSGFTDATNVNDFAKEAMSWAVGSRVITGKDNGTKLDPQGNASRVECATIITRFTKYTN